MENAVILCIDDERVVLNGLQSQLSREFGGQYGIELTESGEEALALMEELQRSGHDIPIVISDQVMPGLKGHEVLKHIHKASPSTYTVLLTGQSDFEAVTEAINYANLYRYIAKPWESNDLIMTVREAIKGYFQDKQLEEQNRLLERHNKELEKLVEERTLELTNEKRKSDELLLNILPEQIASELKQKGEATSRHYQMVSVLFTDFQGFTKSASEITPEELILTLNECFSAFDDIIDRHNLEKIKTIGDGYMAVAGAPIPCADHAQRIALAALEMQQDIKLPDEFREYLPEGVTLGIRIGLHTGSVVGGVIGDERFVYDIYSDAVNTAARMESHGEPGKIHVSEEFKHAVETQNIASLQFIERGEMDIKGKGLMKTYFLEIA